MSKLPSTRSSPRPATNPGSKSRIHTGAVSSDEDEEQEQPRRRLQKKPRRKVNVDEDDDMKNDSEARKALESLMNMDDGLLIFLSFAGVESLISSPTDQVEKVSRNVPAARQEEAEENPDVVMKTEDVGMSDDAAVKTKPKPRKKKEKKVVPMGRNGLKKRRVMKSRTRIDDKGYMGKSFTASIDWRYSISRFFVFFFVDYN
jgi:DNA polymerase delta subunit 3